MLETRTKATSTSHQTSTLPETQLAEIRTSASAKTYQEETDTILTFHINLIVSKALVQHYCVVSHRKYKLKAVRHAPCIRSDSKAVSKL